MVPVSHDTGIFLVIVTLHNTCITICTIHAITMRLYVYSSDTIFSHILAILRHDRHHTYILTRVSKNSPFLALFCLHRPSEIFKSDPLVYTYPPKPRITTHASRKSKKKFLWFNSTIFHNIKQKKREPHSPHGTTWFSIYPLGTHRTAQEARKSQSGMMTWLTGNELLPGHF